MSADISIAYEEHENGLITVRISSPTVLLDSLLGPDKEKLRKWADERVRMFEAFPLLRRDKRR